MFKKSLTLVCVSLFSIMANASIHKQVKYVVENELGRVDIELVKRGRKNVATLSYDVKYVPFYATNLVLRKDIDPSVSISLNKFPARISNKETIYHVQNNYLNYEHNSFLKGKTCDVYLYYNEYKNDYILQVDVIPHKNTADAANKINHAELLLCAELAAEKLDRYLPKVKNVANVKDCTIIPQHSSFDYQNQVVDHGNINKAEVKKVEKWEDCYELALKKAQEEDYTIYDYRDHSVEYYQTIKWEFNDSIIPYGDTSGIITKHTPKYIPTPKKGDFRYRPDGKHFVHGEHNDPKSVTINNDLRDLNNKNLNHEDNHINRSLYLLSK